MDMLEVIFTRPDKQVYALVTGPGAKNSIQLITPQGIPTKERVFSDIYRARSALICAAKRDDTLKVSPLPGTSHWSKYPVVQPVPKPLLVIHEGQLSTGFAAQADGQTIIMINGRRLRSDAAAWWSYL